MNWRRWILGGVLGASLCAPGCTGSKGGDAVVATAVTVAAVGANRALTRECWAACSPGYVCDQDRGVCRPGECAPACVEPDQCTLVGTKYQCVPAQRSVVHNFWPVTRNDYRPTADADLGKRKASVPPGTAPTSPESIAGHSEYGTTLVKSRSKCPRPGSDEWYADVGASGSVGAVAGDTHRDLIGVWKTEDNALGSSKALAITPTAVFQHGARVYEVLREDRERLLLRAHPPLTGVSTSEFEVRFVHRDRIDFGGVVLERYDCRAEGSHAALCCQLPRARWVVLSAE